MYICFFINASNNKINTYSNFVVVIYINNVLRYLYQLNEVENMHDFYWEQSQRFLVLLWFAEYNHNGRNDHFQLRISGKIHWCICIINAYVYIYMYIRFVYLFFIKVHRPRLRTVGLNNRYFGRTFQNSSYQLSLSIIIKVQVIQVTDTHHGHC